MSPFKKLATLVTFMVFASHGAMATPIPHFLAPAPEPLLDSLLQNLGDILGTAAGGVLPAGTTAQVIKGAGGIAARAEDPQALLDSLLQNLGNILGTVAGDVLPAGTTTQVIKGAGGVVTRDEDPQALLDSLLQNLGNILGTVAGDVLPAGTTAQVIKGAGGVATREEDPQVLDSLLQSLGIMPADGVRTIAQFHKGPGGERKCKPQDFLGFNHPGGLLGGFPIGLFQSLPGGLLQGAGGEGECNPQALHDGPPPSYLANLLQSFPGLLQQGSVYPGGLIAKF